MRSQKYSANISIELSETEMFDGKKVTPFVLILCVQCGPSLYLLPILRRIWRPRLSRECFATCGASRFPRQESYLLFRGRELYRCSSPAYCSTSSFCLSPLPSCASHLCHHIKCGYDAIAGRGYIINTHYSRVNHNIIPFLSDSITLPVRGGPWLRHFLKRKQILTCKVCFALQQE